MHIFRALVWLYCKLTTILKNIKNLYYRHVHSQKFPAASTNSVIPRSVNYHLTRQCNYQCGFCFHTAKTSFVLPIEEAQKGLTMLKEAGMEKVNFSGGEPFLPQKGRYLGQLVYYCKEVLKMPSVTIISNGSLVTEAWFRKYGQYLDILAISCDSINEETNRVIGRGQGNKNHVEKLMKIRSWCHQYKVAFKINTVVNTYNIDEDMTEWMLRLKPIRWKVFQCLLLEGENTGAEALRQAEDFYVTEEQFKDFLQRHRHIPFLVAESNVKMQNSYLILDEYMRFLNCQDGAKKPSHSILDVGVRNALDKSGFDEIMFLKRGGIYKWSKASMNLEW